MPNHSDKPALTLADTIIRLAGEHPDFADVNCGAVRRDADDHYANDLGRCGELMISRGTITRDQLALALARQAQDSGDHKQACSHLDKLKQERHSRGLALLGELTSILGTLSGRAS
jgi:hypothetical protein